jgi:hypothetical protein
VLTDLDRTPPKKNKCSILRRSYAIPDISAVVPSAAESEHEPQVSNDEYIPQNRPESQGDVDDEDLYDDDPTPKKKQKKIKVPVRETINASRKEHASEPLARKAENKASHLKY